MVACDVFKRNVNDGSETILSLDDAYMELCEYYDSFTIQNRLLRGDLLSTLDHVYEALTYTIDN